MQFETDLSLSKSIHGYQQIDSANTLLHYFYHLVISLVLWCYSTNLFVPKLKFPLAEWKFLPPFSNYSPWLPTKCCKGPIMVWSQKGEFVPTASFLLIPKLWRNTFTCINGLIMIMTRYQIHTKNLNGKSQFKVVAVVLLLTKIRNCCGEKKCPDPGRKQQNRHIWIH